MSSPFPGMDPYIEGSEIWSDFHSDLAGEIRANLNPAIQPNYVARMISRVTYDLVEVSQTRAIIPDVAVWETDLQDGRVVESAVAIPPAPVESTVLLELPVRLLTVEIRLTSTMELVTAIEILSPVNKRKGHRAHREYLRKRRELLRSAANLMEIDLLREGERPPLESPVPATPYYVVLSRALRRPTVEVWPIQLQDELPLLPVPLLEPDPDVPLDLGEAVRAVYKRGGYTSIIDYTTSPPAPSFSVEDEKWMQETINAGKH